MGLGQAFHMKFKIFFLLLASLITKASLSQKSDTLYAEMTFIKTSIDTTTIKVSTPATFKYFFQNTGNMSLTIRYVGSLCNCIIPVWSKETIKAGGWGWVECVYDPQGHLGNFSKQVIVYSDARNGSVNLNMKGYTIK